MAGHHHDQRSFGFGGVSRLAAGCLVILFLWLAVLPAVARQGAVRRHIERNRARGIHPDAMFYTEIGAIDGVRVEYENGRPVFKRMRVGSPPGE